MPATSTPSVHDLRAQFERLLAAMCDGEAQTMTADTLERRLLGQILALGRSLFALFLATGAATTAAREYHAPDGTRRPAYGQRARSYLSIFGPLVFARPYFYQPGAGGVAPVDAPLSRPAHACSDLVRETLEELAVESPFHTGARAALLTGAGGLDADAARTPG